MFMKNQRLIWTTFFALIIITILVVSGTFIGEWLHGKTFLPAIALFCLFGIILTILTFKSKIKGKPRKFLLLTGVSAVGFFVFVILHNFFYALSIVTSKIAALSFLMEIFHIIFFFISTIACPIGFLIGVVGSLVLFFKKR